MKFKESVLAHRWLNGLEGIEIGASAHNPFGLKTRNVDYSAGMTVFKQEEASRCGEVARVDIVAPGDQLPLADNSVDFVISSHVIEHFPDPIKALKEWHRVVRPGGYIYVIAPHKERTFDRDRPRTTLAELIERHQTGKCPHGGADEHCSVWITEDLVDLMSYLEWPIVAVQDTDDKVGNGSAVVVQVAKDVRKQAESARIPAHRAERRMSMTFLLGPTGPIRTANAACTLEYARRLQERGHTVSITTWPRFLWQGDEPFPGLDFRVPIYFSAAKPEDLPVQLLDQSPRDYAGELQYFLAFQSLLIPAIPKADLVISANWEGVIPAWQSRQGKPVHFPQHYDEVGFTLDEHPSAGLRSNPLIKMLCRNALQMPVYRIANSTWLAGEFQRRFGENVPFVKHGIDAKRFHPNPKLSVKDGVIRVVTYCRPEKWKGFQDAVPAMQELMRRYPHKIEWRVYGFAHPTLGPGNPLAPYTFLGALAQDELSRLYAESDIALCPPWYEGFALPPLEAMACGTAVITTRYGTEDYAIDGHNAIVARPRVVSDLAVALDGLVRIPELRERLARNGRAMAESLTWESAVGAREELLWRIHRNALPNNALHGLDNGLVDGHGISFERLAAEVGARDGELLHGADGEHYMVELGRLRRIADPSAAGFDPRRARPLDRLSLLRNEHGPSITSTANDYGLRALSELVAS